MNDLMKTPSRDPDDRLDAVLRQELHWETPPEVSARLLALVPGNQVPALAVPAPPRPQSWYSMLVLMLTAAAVGLSLGVAWQFYGTVGAELGLIAMFEQLRYAPLIGLQRLYDALPASRQVVAILLVIRDQIHWLLLAIMLWLAFDQQPQRQTVRN